MAADCQEERLARPKLSSALIGSCTNSSYEDIGARPTSRARRAARREGQGASSWCRRAPSRSRDDRARRPARTFEAIGGTVLANACGPCIGQWKRDDVKKGEKNSIVTSFNRNFPAQRRQPETHAFIGSPRARDGLRARRPLDFNPLTDSSSANDGSRSSSIPPDGASCPPKGFVARRTTRATRRALAGRRRAVGGRRSIPKSERLQLLEPFAALGRQGLTGLAPDQGQGQVHDGPHLDGRPLAQVPRPPRQHLRQHVHRRDQRVQRRGRHKVKNQLTGEKGQCLPGHRPRLQGRGRRWVVVGDENYGEGSSPRARRDGAAPPGRVRAVIVRSFARIHETNLKKQGMLALTFANPATTTRSARGAPRR
jgi:aconitate hydratase